MTGVNLLVCAVCSAILNSPAPGSFLVSKSIKAFLCPKEADLDQDVPWGLDSYKSN
jgi:hypothetical protein